MPDYLKITSELIRVTKPQGIIYIDHEASPAYWKRPKILNDFLKDALPAKKKLSAFRLLHVNTYITKIKALQNPRYLPEGDLHVWPDDHIDWQKIRDLFIAHKCEIITQKEYLNYSSDYPIEIYEQYKNSCATDMLLIARKN